MAPTVTAFLGMRGNGDWATDERPKSWREGILLLYPNGMAPLTAILSKMGEESVTDPEFNWWTKALPTQGGAVTGVYTDAGLSTAISSAGSSGDTVFVKAAEATIDEIRAGHQVTLRYASDPSADVVGKVNSVVKNGASSYASVKLLEDDDNSLTSSNLTDCDEILVTGSINAEGASMPDAIAYKPTKYTNYTQILRTPLSLTRTAMATKLRTRDAYKEAKRECLELHSIEMEKAFIWGVPSEGTGSNGKPERTTGGIAHFIRTNASANLLDYRLDSDFAGDNWLTGGEEWLDDKLELIFRYGSQEKLAFAGSGAVLGINKLVKDRGDFTFKSTTASYGIKILEWVTPFGVINIKTHPLFSYNATDRNSLLIMEPRNLKYKYIDDTMFKPDKSTGNASVDGKNEEFLSECGLEMHFPDSFGLLLGVGLNNELA